MVRAASGDDTELLSEVSSLLASHEQAGSFLDNPVVGMAGLEASGSPATGANDDAPVASTHRVTRGTLLISVTEDGNLESASNKDIKCQIEGGSSILWIVEDGKEVKKDEELVHLDQSFVEDKLNSQKIVYGNALTAKIQAEKDVLEAASALRTVAARILGGFNADRR